MAYTGFPARWEKKTESFSIFIEYFDSLNGKKGQNDFFHININKKEYTNSISTTHKV